MTPCGSISVAAASASATAGPSPCAAGIAPIASAPDVSITTSAEPTGTIAHCERHPHVRTEFHRDLDPDAARQRRGSTPGAHDGRGVLTHHGGATDLHAVVDTPQRDNLFAHNVIAQTLGEQFDGRSCVDGARRGIEHRRAVVVGQLRQ